MIEMNRYGVRVRRIIDQGQPLHNVSLNRVRKVVNCIRAIRQAKIDDCRGLRLIGCVAPKQIRSMQVVVRPQRSERRNQRQ